MWSIDSSTRVLSQCMSQIKALIEQLENRITAIGLATAGAALLAYFRSEVTAAAKWLLDPLTLHLPWHRSSPPRSKHETQSLRSELTVADVFLITPDGRRAKYEKTGNYVVQGEALGSYYEGVTASGNASDFSTERGAIVQTTKEHGFYVSRIDLGSVFEAGTQFQNVYRVCLHDSFTAEEEHWTQEIACATDHLTLRIHFPARRPPRLIRCKRVVGLTETQIRTEATTTELFGQTAIVWEIERPTLGDIYKLEWRW
jgi:hypothetical protein